MTKLAEWKKRFKDMERSFKSYGFETEPYEMCRIILKLIEMNEKCIDQRDQCPEMDADIRDEFNAELLAILEK